MAKTFISKLFKWFAIVPLGGGTIALTVWLVHANKPLNRVYETKEEEEKEEEKEPETKEDKPSDPTNPPQDPANPPPPASDPSTPPNGGAPQLPGPSTGPNLPSGQGPSDPSGSNPSQVSGANSAKSSDLIKILKQIGDIDANSAKDDIYELYQLSITLPKAEEGAKNIQQPPQA